MDNSMHEAVKRIYREADAEIAAAGPICLASGKCCRFKEYGHTLFLSNLEAEVLLAGAPGFTGPITSDFCPYQSDMLCTAREPRPLGCRVYYCDPSYQAKSHEISEKYVQRLKELARDKGLPWRYAPLHTFLLEHQKESESCPES